MKVNILIAGIAVLASLASCKPGNQASTASGPEKTKDQATTVSTGTDGQTATSRLIVSFISIGEGTDFKAKDSMDVYITRFQDQNKKTIKYDAVPWGREGEVDYCFMLNELSAKEQKQFVEGIRSALKFSELVQITENQPCKQRR